MVQIDHRIAMMGQQPNIVNALAQGTQAAGQVANLRRQAEGQNLFRQHGAGIMAGDPTAMNALAGFDPAAAMDVQRQRQQMTIGEAQIAQIKQSTRLAAEKHAASMDAAEAAMEAQKIANGLNMALPLVIKARETGDVAELNQGLQTLGLPPVRDVNEALVQVAQHEAVFEVLERVTEMTAGPSPLSGAGKVQADINAGILPKGTPLRGEAVKVVNQGGSYPGLSKLGEGYTYLYDENGQIRRDEMGRPLSAPIPGSKAARDAAEASRQTTEDAEKSQRKADEKNLMLGTTLTNLNLNISALENPNMPVTGPVGEARRTWIGRVLTGSDAVDFQNRSDQIADAAALSEIQRMRDNSKTGGAVGALTDGERVAIGNAVTALNTATSSEEYLRAAKAFRELALNLAYGEGMWELDEKTGALSFKERGSAPSRYENMNLDALLLNAPQTEEEAAAWNKRWEALGGQ